jgi:uncharacterized protein (TIGR03086 family)
MTVDRPSGEDRRMGDADRSVSELIELGRDREAAVRGAARMAGAAATADAKGAPMDPLTQFDRLGPLLAGVVSNITPDQLDLASPCSDFTVRGVLEHMIGGATAFTAAFRGEAPGAPDTTDVLASFGPALAGLAAAVSAQGALDRTIATPFGDLGGDTFARFVVLDGLVHGWDLATATRQEYAPPDDLVAAVDAFAHETIDPLRDGQTFADAIESSADASPIERLAAYTGRAVSTEAVR